jgi:hypothetical protein
MLSSGARRGSVRDWTAPQMGGKAMTMNAVVIPILWGKPINIWLGMALAVLVAFQLLTGLRLIKLPFKVHLASGVLIFLIAVVHATIGIGVWFANWRY